MVRITKVYTKNGDQGSTHLVDGSSVSKSCERVAAYGEIDELNSKLSEVLELSSGSDEVNRKLLFLQNQLFDLGAALATPPGFTYPNQIEIVPQDVARLEGWIDELNEHIPPLMSFVIPGGSPRNALLHSARAICRRAERAVVELHTLDPLSDAVIQYANRLSDLLFVMARYEVIKCGKGERLWQMGMTP